MRMRNDNMCYIAFRYGAFISIKNQIAMPNLSESIKRGGLQLEKLYSPFDDSESQCKGCNLLNESGKCPSNGCTKEVDGKWRVISNKTGKLWPAHYDTKSDAEDALAAYHAH